MYYIQDLIFPRHEEWMDIGCADTVRARSVEGGVSINLEMTRKMRGVSKKAEKRHDPTVDPTSLAELRRKAWPWRSRARQARSRAQTCASHSSQ